jgi:hypothetical protein
MGSDLFIDPPREKPSKLWQRVKAKEELLEAKKYLKLKVHKNESLVFSTRH